MRRTAGERLAAWLLTGPLGHLYAFLADVAALWLRWAAAQARRRLVSGARRRLETMPARRRRPARQGRGA